jgi:hypothetical protein
MGPQDRSVAHRVKWPGYHVFNESGQANNFTVAEFIEGNLWLPSTDETLASSLFDKRFQASHGFAL